MTSRGIIERSRYICSVWAYIKAKERTYINRKEILHSQQGAGQLSRKSVIYVVMGIGAVCPLLLQIYNLFLFFFTPHPSFYHCIHCIISSLSLLLGQGATLLLTSMHPLLPNMKLVLECKAAIDLISDHPTLFLFYLQMHTFHVQKDGTVFGYLSRDLYSVICVVFYVNARQRNQTMKRCMGSWELTMLRFELTDKRCLVLFSLPIIRT